MITPFATPLPRSQIASQPPVAGGRVTPFRGVWQRSVSVFSATEQVFTRTGSTAMGDLYPGAEVLTASGFRRLIAKVPQHRPRADGVVPPAGAFDPRKLLRVQGAVVELLTGLPVALIRLADLQGKFGLPAIELAAPGYGLRFAAPEMVITERGSFASQDHENLPPLLSQSEALLVLTSLGFRCDHVAA